MAEDNAPKEKTRFCVACHCEVRIYEPQFNLLGGKVLHEGCVEWWKEHLRKLSEVGGDGERENEL